MHMVAHAISLSTRLDAFTRYFSLADLGRFAEAFAVHSLAFCHERGRGAAIFLPFLDFMSNDVGSTEAVGVGLVFGGSGGG